MQNGKEYNAFIMVWVITSPKSNLRCSESHPSCVNPTETKEKLQKTINDEGSNGTINTFYFCTEHLGDFKAFLQPESTGLRINKTSWAPASERSARECVHTICVLHVLTSASREGFLTWWPARMLCPYSQHSNNPDDPSLLGKAVISGL